MRILGTLILCLSLGLSSSLCYADLENPVEWTEEDGSPSAFPYKIVATNGKLTNSGGVLSVDLASASSTPGGATTQVQFNDASSFGGDGSFTYNKTLNVLGISRDAGQTGFAIVISGDNARSLGGISKDGSASFSNVQGVPSSFGITIDGGGSVITTGLKGYLIISRDMQIRSWNLASDVSGTIRVDVWKDTFANAPPTVTDSIVGSEIPRLASAQFSRDTALATWSNTTVTNGDVIAFSADSAATVTRVTLTVNGITL